MHGPGNGMVAAGHPLTAEAGARVLREGGNAVDAAIAAVLTSWTAEPLLSGPGAGGYLLVAGAGERPALLDFFVGAPGAGADPAARGELLPVDVCFGSVVQVFHVGAPSCGVPGTPAGLTEAARRWGSVALAELAAPAARLARDGVSLNRAQAYVFEILAPILLSSPEARALFAPAGDVLAEGDVYRNPELGDTIERLGAEGAEPFQRGDLAAALVDWVGRHGGLLTAEDLAGYCACDREPTRASYRGRTVLTNPPPSAGGILLALAMARLDGSGGGPPALREVVEVMAAVQAERTPAFTAGLAEDGFAERFLTSQLGSTTHVSVLDGDGLACSVTCTNGEGSGVVVPGTGIHVNNVMGEEDLSPLGFFRDPPGRRMPSMMAPTIVLAPDGSVELVLGSAGSNRIRSAILQTIVGVVDHGLRAREAVLAPRVHFEAGVVYVEPGVPLAELDATEYELALFEDLNLFFGGVQAVERDPESGELTGAGDPRRGEHVRAATAALTAVGAATAGCGGEAGDLLAVERSGSIPGARLDVRVTVDGRAACNRGELRQLPSDQVLTARRIERALAGEDDDPGPAARDVRLRPGPRSIMRYRARVEAGTVAFADTSRGQPPAFFQVAKLTRDVARGTCGLRR